MGRSKQPVHFQGANYQSIASLYSAASAIRDGSEIAFDACMQEFVRLLRAAGELSVETKPLRIRRVRACTRSKVYYDLFADLSDNTTTGKLSLRKACRVAFISA